MTDLATLYGVATKHLNQQVKRNRGRFPDDFMVRLTLREAQTIARSRSYSATLNRGQNVKHAPHAFTEHGVVMLASVLKSRVAIQASVQVVRAFIRFRAFVAAHEELRALIEEQNRRISRQDEQIQTIFQLVETFLQTGSAGAKSRIGFKP